MILMNEKAIRALNHQFHTTILFYWMQRYDAREQMYAKLSQKIILFSPINHRFKRTFRYLP